jgi:hypothetical protein
LKTLILPLLSEKHIINHKEKIMKKRVFIFAFAAIGFAGYFSSCIEDYSTDANPTIEVVSPTSDTIVVAIGDSVAITIDLSSENTLASFQALSSSPDVEISNGSKSFTATSDETVTVMVKVKGSATPNSTTTLTFTVVDQGKQTSVQRVILAEGLSAAKDFTWQRIGNASATGLDAFGLSWTQNTSTNAVIKKGATKFVELAAGSWATIQSANALKSAIDAATDMDKWEKVSATDASKTYDLTLGTIKDNTYYLIHITHSTVTLELTGAANITIKGQFKQ